MFQNFSENMYSWWPISMPICGNFVRQFEFEGFCEFDLFLLRNKKEGVKYFISRITFTLEIWSRFLSRGSLWKGYIYRQYKSGPTSIAQFNLFQYNLHTYFFYELPIILVWSFCLAWKGITFGFGDECSFLRFYKIVISVSFCKYKKAMEILELSVWNSSSWFAFTSLKVS